MSELGLLLTYPIDCPHCGETLESHAEWDAHTDAHFREFMGQFEHENHMARIRNTEIDDWVADQLSL